MNYGGQLPSQTHCFPPSRLQALPWSSRGISVGTIYKALLLNPVLIYLAHRTSISSRSPCFDLLAPTVQNEAARGLNPNICNCWTGDDKGHVKSPMEIVSPGETQGTVYHSRTTQTHSFSRGPGKMPLIYNDRLFQRQFSGWCPDFSYASVFRPGCLFESPGETLSTYS